MGVFDCGHFLDDWIGFCVKGLDCASGLDCI